eukprot:gene26115-biopygen14135
MATNNSISRSNCNRIGWDNYGHRFHHNSVQFVMNSCHEEGVRGRNRAGIEYANPGIGSFCSSSIPNR